MSGYLEGYGIKDSLREGKVKLVAGAAIAVVILTFAAWYNLRTFSEVRVVKGFLSLLAAKNYAEAYKLWGCSLEQQCRDYAFDKFQADWGPASPFADVSDVSIVIAEPCGNSVWVSIIRPKQQELGLAVDPDTKQLGFAPETRCPGVWRIREIPERLSAYMKRQRAESDAGGRPPAPNR